ncbi:hypothetical protein [Pseudonocardia sp. H11422]|uniref:hypothetical protein n=1 Tax=Pseudonocardia sp. H11422 TaxID=2835866 RepID=UPI001BDCEDD1|nr:hypothetical protein [Pseudonocardia sp. H11422]
MSHQTSGRPPAPDAVPPTSPSTTDVARGEATDLGRSTAQAGVEVAETATEQAKDVAGETRRQAGDLLDQAREQVQEQARTGQQQAAHGLHSLADELHQMAGRSEQSGPVTDLAHQAAEHATNVAEWLDHREPGDLLQEVRRLARRRPGAFLLGAAMAGVLAGRLTRGVATTRSEHRTAARAPARTDSTYPAGSSPSAGGPGATGGFPPPGPPTHVYPPAGAPGRQPPAPGDTPPLPVAPGGPPAAYPPPGTGYEPPGGSRGYATPPDAGYGPPDGPGHGGPAHAPRPGANTVGEHAEDPERGGAGPPGSGPRRSEGGRR